MKPERMDEDQIEGIVQDAVQDAVDFIESEIAQDRIKSQRYFDGEVDIGQEVGRSKVVATKVRDAVRSIKPSLMLIVMIFFAINCETSEAMLCSFVIGLAGAKSVRISSFNFSMLTIDEVAQVFPFGIKLSNRLATEGRNIQIAGAIPIEANTLSDPDLSKFIQKRSIQLIPTNCCTPFMDCETAATQSW